jgi:RES domain-containing protein
VGARFTPPGTFDSIYLADNPVTAFLEVSALVQLPGGPAPIRSAPWVVVTVEGALHHMLDLTDARILSALGSSVAETTGPWVLAEQPPTQLLGRLAHDSGRITGMRYASAKHPGGINMAIFPDRLNLHPQSHLEVYDPHGLLAQRLP